MNKVYKVVKIIDEYRLVVNAGRKDGIKEGDILEIFVLGEEIKDPETGESLGTLDVIKARLEVQYVYEKMSLCTNAEFKTVSNLSALESIGSLFSGTRVRKELNVNRNQITGGYDTDVDKEISIGDKVRKVNLEKEKEKKDR